MDQLIYEEFKGTGNSELVLSRELAERRIFPAVDLQMSGTRREELLLSPEMLATTQKLRQQISRLTSAAAMEQVLALLKRAPTNADLATLVAGS